LSVLWAHKANIWGSLSPAGVLGLFWLPVTIPAIFILAEGGLGNGALLGFETPGFQNVAVALLIALGTVAVCAALASHAARTGRRRWLLPTVMSAMVVNCLVWSVLWLPKVSTNWLLVSPAAATTLRDIKAEIGTNDQVVVSQGVAGPFSERRWINVIFSSTAVVPLHRRTVWIIFAPQQGIEGVNISGVYADIAALEKNPSMHLMAAANGIWAFKWTAPAGATTVSIRPVAREYAPGWTIAGASGTAVRKGPASEWYASSKRSPGYVVDQAYWRGLPGTYRASFTLSVAKGTYANAELWDSTAGTVLGRLVVKHTNGRRTFELTAKLRRTVGQPVIGGHALWAIKPPGLPGDDVEIRVWSPGRAARVRVYRVELKQLTGAHLNADTDTLTAQQQLNLGPG
jgi:hypothetical protein